MSQANTEEEAFEELRAKTGGTLTVETLPDDPDEEVDMLLIPNGTLLGHGAWIVYASLVDDNGFAEATW